MAIFGQNPKVIGPAKIFCEAHANEKRKTAIEFEE
jgi:hypothetical protein